uniref:Kidney androgen-regulated protein n=1 Tax=Heterorhabditis bacteriophora TaxID=37862 RepID=A0A1I7XM06_HETBA
MLTLSLLFWIVVAQACASVLGYSVSPLMDNHKSSRLHFTIPDNGYKNLKNKPDLESINSSTTVVVRKENNNVLGNSTIPYSTGNSAYHETTEETSMSSQNKSHGTQSGYNVPSGKKSDDKFPDSSTLSEDFERESAADLVVHTLEDTIHGLEEILTGETQNEYPRYILDNEAAEAYWATATFPSTTTVAVTKPKSASHKLSEDLVQQQPSSGIHVTVVPPNPTRHLSSPTY